MQHTSARRSLLAATALFAALTLTAPAALHAQAARSSASTPTPSQVVDQLLSMVEHEMVPLAEAMPADKYNFVPSNGNFQGVRSFAGQLQHVIHANYGMFARASSIKPSSMPNIDSLTTKPQLVQALKDSFAFAHQAVGTLNSQNALEQVQPADGINTRAGIMLFAIVHMNDHYGQMVEYLRMNGIVPPASRR